MKRKIPLEILELLQPLTDKNLDTISPVRNAAVIFHVTDNSEHSDFFFKIVRQEQANTKPGYIIEYCPKNKQEVGVYKVWVQSGQITQDFENWLTLVRTYNSIQTVYDDPILKSNQERFEKQFEILEEDAETSSFDLNQQIYLNEYLDNVQKKILSLKSGKTDEEINALDNLEKEAENIQRNLTRESKKQIIKHLSRLWAKAQLLGLDIIKEIFVNYISDLTKKLLTGGL
jgi:hypothetical protein